jgi:hypothetical protein
MFNFILIFWPSQVLSVIIVLYYFLTIFPINGLIVNVLTSYLESDDHLNSIIVPICVLLIFLTIIPVKGLINVATSVHSYDREYDDPLNLWVYSFLLIIRLLSS